MKTSLLRVQNFRLKETTIFLTSLSLINYCIAGIVLVNSIAPLRAVLLQESPAYQESTVAGIPYLAWTTSRLENWFRKEGHLLIKSALYLESLNFPPKAPLCNLIPLRPFPGGPKACRLALVLEPAAARSCAIGTSKVARSWVLEPGSRVYSIQRILRCNCDHCAFPLTCS